MDLQQRIGNKIRDLRKSNGDISQEALAKAVGVVTNTISRWETGTYKTSVEDLDKLARFFKVSILDFLPQEEQPVPPRMVAFLRAVQSLPEAELNEVQRYAEFCQTRQLLKTANKKAKKTTQ